MVRKGKGKGRRRNRQHISREHRQGNSKAMRREKTPRVLRKKGEGKATGRDIKREPSPAMWRKGKGKEKAAK